MRILQLEKGKPNAEILNLLNQNIIGTPGKSLVYQHRKATEKLNFIGGAYFPNVKLGGKIIGAACFIPRSVQINQRHVSAVYIRYFSFRQSFRSASAPIDRLQKSSVLKKEVLQVFEENVLQLPQEHIFYAYVDPGNIRSKRIIEEFGFQEVGTFKTVFFSRFFPRQNQNIRVVSRDFLSENMSKFHLREQFYFQDYLGYQDGLLAYFHEGEPVAALQANTEHWKVFEIPGGKNLISWISKIPLINRLFHSDFRFVSLEAVTYQKGFEWAIPDLISHALAQHQRNTAIICLDPKSEIYSLFQKIDRGFIQKITSEKEMAVVARGKGIDLNSIAQFPIYVSGFDNM